GHRQGIVAARRAGILVEVFDQPRRRIRVEMIYERLVAHVDLFPLEKRGNGNDDRELLDGALEVARHRHHGAVAIPHQYDLRCAIEQLRVGLADVEPAEPGDRRARPREAEREGHAEEDPFHHCLLESTRHGPREAGTEPRAAASTDNESPGTGDRGSAPPSTRSRATRAGRWSGTTGTARTKP